jgi:hypothetical protein
VLLYHPVAAGGRAAVRLLGLRSTITVLAVPSAPPEVRTRALLREAAIVNSSARTSSTGRSIKAAAISACYSSSPVSPCAAAIASFSVGGSNRTLRRPYFVFQTSGIMARPAAACFDFTSQ